MELHLLKKLITDHVVLKNPLHRLVVKYKKPAVELRELIDGNPDLVNQAKAARKSILRRNYENLAPKAQKALKDILALDPSEPVTAGKENAVVGYTTNASLVKVQKEIAEGVLEAIGAKPGRPKGGGINFNINNGERSRERGGIDHVMARPMKEILASCSLDKGELVKIVSTKELESSGVKNVGV